MILNELKSSFLLLSSFKHFKLFNQNQTALISIFTNNKNSIEKNVNNKTNSINDDWFQKLTAKSKADTSAKVNLDSLSQEEKRKLIIEIWQMEKERGLKPMPKTIEEEDLQNMSKNVTSKSNIISSLQRLLKEQYYREQKEKRKEMIQKRHEENEKKLADDNFQTNYWGHKTFLRRIGNHTEKYIERARVLSSIVNNSPSLVLDFRFENKLKQISAQKSLFRQIAEVININRSYHEPFQLHFCNLDKNGWFNENYGKILSFDNNMVFDTSKSYMDIFPREKLVYLSRDAKTTMKYFDPNKVYIIGAMIDKGPSDFLYASYGQAKQDKIECQRLPLDNYVKFAGGKNLNIDHMTRILINLYHNHSDWEKALRESLPKRKVQSFNSDVKARTDLYQNRKKQFT